MPPSTKRSLPDDNSSTNNLTLKKSKSNLSGGSLTPVNTEGSDKSKIPFGITNADPFLIENLTTGFSNNITLLNIINLKAAKLYEEVRVIFQEIL